MIIKQEPLTETTKALIKVQKQLDSLQKQISKIREINFDGNQKGKPGRDHEGNGGNSKELGDDHERNDSPDKSGYYQPGIFNGRGTEQKPNSSQYKDNAVDGDSLLGHSIVDHITKNIQELSTLTKGLHVLHRNFGVNQEKNSHTSDALLSQLNNELPEGYFNVGLAGSHGRLVHRQKGMTKQEILGFVQGMLAQGKDGFKENNLTITETKTPLKSRILRSLKRLFFPIEGKVEVFLEKQSFKSWVTETIPRPGAKQLLGALKDMDRSKVKGKQKVYEWAGKNMHRDLNSTICAVRAATHNNNMNDAWSYMNMVGRVTKHCERDR